ncbi:MAG: 2Fe-2S iron-sulfur cluster binding domain-containing protein [Rivularia sp. (in: cyanobacteria)]
MTNKKCNIQFLETNHQSIELEINQNLAEYLTIENSPILFGCRTGICGTCIVAIEGDIPPASSEEIELLEVLAPENPKARLACQIQLTNDIEITKIK